MSITRATIIRGPGVCKTGSVIMHSAGGISCDFTVETVPVPTDIFGEVDRLVSSRYCQTSLVPTGALNAGLIALLYPYQTPDIGASFLGAADVPFLIQSKAGQLLTLVNYGIWQPPTLRLAAAAPAFSGPAQFRHLIADGAESDVAASYYTIAPTAYQAATYPPAADTITGGAVTAAVGATAVKSTAGFELAVQLGWEPVPSDNDGVVDYTLSSVAASITFQPAAGTEAALLALMPAGGVGSSAASGNEFTVSRSDGLACSIHNAHLLQGPLRWGNVTLRQGQLAFAAIAKQNAGVPGAVYTVTYT